jgi:predicted DNA-binding protein (UPF0251 family)
LKKKELKQRKKNHLEADELQTIIYQDIDWLTMDTASKKLWVSKTVYSWIYANARKKIAETIANNNILFLPKEEEKSDDKAKKAKKKAKKEQKKK